MQIKVLWKFKLQYDDISNLHKCLTWQFERNFVQWKESKFILLFYHNTKGSSFSHDHLVSPLKSWTARTTLKMAHSRSQYTSSVGDSRCNPIAAPVYLQAQSFMTSILPSLLPSMFTGLLDRLFQSSMIQSETNNTNTKIIPYLSTQLAELINVKRCREI